MIELVQGKSVDDALKLDKEAIIKHLDGVPEPKIHYSLLAIDGLKRALQHALFRRVFTRSGIVASPEEFDEQFAAGKLDSYFHSCDGNCEIAQEGQHPHVPANESQRT